MNYGTNTVVNGSNQDAIVKLNIGGYKFVTTKATLFSHGENFFTALLKGSIPSLQDEGTIAQVHFGTHILIPVLRELPFNI